MKNFILNQAVKVVGTGSYLDGLTGEVVGKPCALAEMSFYTVWIDNGLLLDGWPTITITQHCLEAV